MYFIIIVFVDYVLYLIIICIYIDYIVIENKREREWNERKRKKGLVLVGYYGNLYKKLNVYEFFVMVIFLCYFYV